MSQMSCMHQGRMIHPVLKDETYPYLRRKVSESSHEMNKISYMDQHRVHSHLEIVLLEDSLSCPIATFYSTMLCMFHILKYQEMRIFYPSLLISG